MTSAFATAVLPNFDSGIVAVTTPSIADVPNTTTSTQLLLSGMSFSNTNGNQRTVKVTDGGGASIVPDITVPANSVVSLDWNLMPITGLRWSASGAGVNGKAWGYL